MEKYYDIYISYRRDDGWKYATVLQGLLSQRDYKTFYQIERGSTGRCNEETRNIIKSSAAILVLLTPRYIEGLCYDCHYVREEITFAISKHKKIIAVLPDDIDLMGSPNHNYPGWIYNYIRDPFVMCFNNRMGLTNSIDNLIKATIVPLIGVPRINLKRATLIKRIGYLFRPSEDADLFDSYIPQETDYDIFISYRRIDGRDHARNIQLALKAAGYQKIFFDYDSIQKGEFTKRIIDAIYSCNDFILVLSPKSMKRCGKNGDPVANEIRIASKYNKNIIPVTIDNKSVVWPISLPQDLEFIRRLQFHDHKSDSYFDSSIEELCTKLTTKIY